MDWKITYYSEQIQNDILALPDTLLARYIRLTGLMTASGPNIGLPHTKSLGDGLYELRLKGKEGIARVCYCVITKQNIIMLHTFIKKSNKIPQKELVTAKKRMKEVLS